MKQCPTCYSEMRLQNNKYVCHCGRVESITYMDELSKQKEDQVVKYTKMIEDFYLMEEEIEKSNTEELTVIIETLVKQTDEIITKTSQEQLLKVNELLSEATDKFLNNKELTKELDTKLTDVKFETLHEKLEFLLENKEFPLAGLLIRNAIEDTLKNKIGIQTFTNEMKKENPTFDLRVGDYITEYKQRIKDVYKAELTRLRSRNNLRIYNMNDKKYIKSLVIMRFGTALGKLEYKSPEAGVKNYDVAKKIKNRIWNTINLLVHFDSDANKITINNKFPNEGDLEKFLRETLKYLKEVRIIQE